MLKKNKGFTLVELIIVIAILAIIMLIAIPNFSGIQQRMKVRADKATAAQIGKAVRVWYTEYQSDPAFKTAVGAGTLPASGSAVKNINAITKLENYVDTGLKPSSLLDTDKKVVEDQYYCVGLSGTGTSEKVVVGITAATTNLPVTAADMKASSHALYDGSAQAASPTLTSVTAYVEP